MLILSVLLAAIYTLGAVIQKNCDENTVRNIGFICLITAVITTYISIRISDSWMNLCTFYNIIFCIFSAGQLILFAIGIDSNELYVFSLQKHTSSTIVKAGIVVALSMIGLSMGAVIASIKSNNNQITEHADDEFSDKAIATVGLLLLIISVPFDLYDKINMAVTSSSLGYLALYSDDYSTIGSIGQTLSLYALPGCFLVSYANRNNKLYRWLPICYLLLRSALILFAGKRGQAIGVVIAIYWFVNKAFNVKNKKKLFLKTAIVCYLLMVIMGTVLEYRSTSNKSITALIGLFFSQFTSFDAIIQIISEFGGSIRPLLENIFYMENGTLEHKYGLTVFGSLFMIIPSFFRFGAYDSLYANGIVGLTERLDTLVNLSYGIGYSLPAEAYYNFGYAGCWLFMIFFGFFIFKFLNNQNQSGMRIALSAAFFSLVIISTRGSSQLIFKYIFMYYFLPGFLIKLMSRDSKKRTEGIKTHGC